MSATHCIHGRDVTPEGASLCLDCEELAALQLLEEIVRYGSIVLDLKKQTLAKLDDIRRRQAESEHVIETDSPIHDWFELSYSSYLVLPRTVLQSMPRAWQGRLVQILEEMEQACDRAGLKRSASYRVSPIDGRGRFVPDPLPHYRHAPNVLEGQKP